jgi:phage terminase Nu1 subunit (DNA packaging protein)
MTAKRIAEGKQRTDYSVSDVTRERQSLAKKGKTCGPNNNMYGKKHTPESIALMKANRKPKVVKDDNCIYELVSPTGEVYTTSNLFNFSKLYNLVSTELRRISKPENQHRRHRGWSVRRQ